MGVDTYLDVAFFAGIFAIIFRSVLMTKDYPRTRSVNLGEDVLSFLITAAFLAWVSILRDGRM